jgi:hypothetical protein
MIGVLWALLLYTWRFRSDIKERHYGMYLKRISFVPESGADGAWRRQRAGFYGQAEGRIYGFRGPFT